MEERGRVKGQRENERRHFTKDVRKDCVIIATLSSEGRELKKERERERERERGCRKKRD